MNARGKKSPQRSNRDRRPITTINLRPGPFAKADLPLRLPASPLPPAAHLRELRARIAQARATLGLEGDARASLAAACEGASDAAALAAYQPHPHHQGVVAQIREMASGRQVLDYLC